MRCKLPWSLAQELLSARFVALDACWRRDITADFVGDYDLLRDLKRRLAALGDKVFAEWLHIWLCLLGLSQLLHHIVHTLDRPAVTTGLILWTLLLQGWVATAVHHWYDVDYLWSLGGNWCFLSLSIAWLHYRWWRMREWTPVDHFCSRLRCTSSGAHLPLRQLSDRLSLVDYSLCVQARL